MSLHVFKAPSFWYSLAFEICVTAHNTQQIKLRNMPLYMQYEMSFN